jgi:PAS domain S-box-containing protein
MRMTFMDEKAFKELSERAEKLLNQRDVASPPEAEDMDFLQLLHELEVHHVELELQNEELRQAREDLESSRNEYLTLFNSAPVAYFTLNPEGLITRFNRVAQEMFDGKPLVNKAFSSLTHPKDRPEYFSCLQKVQSLKRASCELRLLGKDNEMIHTLMEASADHDKGGGFLSWHLTFNDITSQKKAEAELQKAHDELERRVRERTIELDNANASLRQLNETLEQQVSERTQLAEDRAKKLQTLVVELTLAEQRERQRLAKILHDNLQQLLIGAKINSEVLSGNINEGQRKLSETVLELINQSIQISRSLTIELSPPVLHQGLSAVLEWLARRMQENHGLTVQLKTDPHIDPQREDTTVVLYQSVRELLFNVIKHAGVRSACLEMSIDEQNRLRVTVSDQGYGFDPAAVWKMKATGFGLVSIRERLELMGGCLQIKSSSGKGTSFSMIVPLETIKEQDEEEIRKIMAKTRKAKPPGEKIRVLLVDDHAVVRQGLATMLDLYSDIEVGGEAADGQEAIEKARELQPDVILMDISMPKMDGIETTRIIHNEFPNIRIIGLSMHDKQDQAVRMMEAGASAYCTKDGGTDILLSEIRGGGRSNPLKYVFFHLFRVLRSLTSPTDRHLWPVAYICYDTQKQ